MNRKRQSKTQCLRRLVFNLIFILKHIIAFEMVLTLGPVLRRLHPKGRWQSTIARNRRNVATFAGITGGSGDRMILTDAMALLYRSHFAFAHDHRLRTRYVTSLFCTVNESPSSAERLHESSAR
jgi:hypothetical protein